MYFSVIICIYISVQNKSNQIPPQKKKLAKYERDC